MVPAVSAVLAGKAALGVRAAPEGKVVTALKAVPEDSNPVARTVVRRDRVSLTAIKAVIAADRRREGKPAPDRVRTPGSTRTGAGAIACHSNTGIVST